MRYNSAWRNGRAGFWGYSTTTTDSNISAENGTAMSGDGTIRNNSWQRTGTVTFISTDPKSSSFLVPSSGSGFTDIGTYAGR